MHKRFPLPLALAITMGIALWSACKKSDFENVELGDHTAEFAFPLFTTDLLLKDLLFNLLNDTLSTDTIFVNPDNTMTLFYSGDVAEKPASDIFKFLENPAPIPMFDSVVINPISAPGGVTIRVADILSGNIGFVLNNTTPDTLTGYFEVPQMSLQGVTFKVAFTVPPNVTWNSGAISLAGYHLESSNNTLTFKYFAYRPDGVRIQIPNPGLFDVFAITIGLKFTYVEGYWGFQWYKLTRDTIEIDINQTELKGDLKVKDPKVTMRISNSWGFPTRGQIKFLSFIGQNGEEIPLLSNGVFEHDSFDYKDFEYPSWLLGEVGQTKYTDITLNSSNSNIDSIFNSQPTRLIYEVDGISNAQLDPSLIGFITDKSTIKLQLRVELVLEGTVKNFGAEQTMNLDFGEFGSLDSADVEEVEFKLVTENGAPISSTVQIFFRDDAMNYIDSLFIGGPKEVIRSAPIDGNGVATGITRTEEFIKMSAARFDLISKSKDALLKTSFTTANGGNTFVKLLATDKIVVKMGIIVKKRL
ncbi:MAG: hypothetical protein IPH31_02195 [Lewinellaceae bacterium]|nr:hypothetical protein [Lewinellaceae bacterium]